MYVFVLDKEASPDQMRLLVHRRSEYVRDAGTVAAPGGSVGRELARGGVGFYTAARWAAAKELSEEAGLDLAPEEFSPLPAARTQSAHANFGVLLQHYPRVRGPMEECKYEVE